MGIFNIIKSSMDCHKCGRPVEWESKRLVYDGILVADAMQTITLNEKMVDKCMRCVIHAKHSQAWLLRKVKQFSLVMAFVDKYETRETFGFDESFRKNGQIRIGMDKSDPY